MLAVLFRWSGHPEADLARSSELERKALALEDSNGMALDFLCYIDFLQRRYDTAVADGERAVAIYPNCAGCYESLSVALNSSGRVEEGLEAVEKAMRLDPTREAYDAFFVAEPLVLIGGTERRFGLPPVRPTVLEVESVTERRRTDEGQPVQRGTDNRDLAGGRGGGKDAGGMSSARDLRRDLLHLWTASPWQEGSGVGLAMIDSKHLSGVTALRRAQMGNPHTLSSTSGRPRVPL